MQLNTFDQLAGVPNTAILQGASQNYSSSYDERSGMPMIVFSYYTGDNNYMSLELPTTFHGSTNYNSCNSKDPNPYYTCDLYSVDAAEDEYKRYRKATPNIYF